MKRRSFLVIFGLAPVACARSSLTNSASAAASPPKVDRTELSIGAAFGHWICPDYEVACENARVSGMPEPSVRLHYAHITSSADNPIGSELQYLDASGRVVMRQWNRR